MYVEDLTSEESNVFIKEHLESCEDCKKYLINIEKEIPQAHTFETVADKEDRKLIKGIKFSIFQTMLTAVLIGVLVGIFGSMMFFNINEFQAIYIFYPVINFIIGLLSFIIFKRVWIGPVLTLIGGIISSILFTNQTFWLWILIYTFVSLLGSWGGMGIEKIKNSSKTTLKALLAIIGVIIAAVILLVLVIIVDLSPEKSEERAVVEQAEEYLEKNYNNEDYEIYDVLYDNMGNFTLFDYAAKVRNLNTGEEFLVYYNKKADQMEDSLKYELE